MNINEFKHNNSEALQIHTAEDKHLHLIKDDTALLIASMQNGKKLIISGFAVAILGILIYCIPTISLTLEQNSPVFNVGGLLFIGAGVLLWIIGAVKYLNAAIDSNNIDDSF